MHPTSLEYVALAVFQQDGATVHTTIRARKLAKEQVRGGGKCISRLTKHPWPGPDLSPPGLGTGA